MPNGDSFSLLMHQPKWLAGISMLLAGYGQLSLIADFHDVAPRQTDRCTAVALMASRTPRNSFAQCALVQLRTAWRRDVMRRLCSAIEDPSAAKIARLSASRWCGFTRYAADIDSASSLRERRHSEVAGPAKPSLGRTVRVREPAIDRAHLLTSL